MVLTCCVFGCHKRGGREQVSFYRIPCNSGNSKSSQLILKRRNAWISSINRKDWTPSKYSRVCSQHFMSGKPAELSDTCNPDWVPHINMGYSLETDPVVSQLRYIRSLARQRKSQEINDEPLTEVESGISCQTDLTAADISKKEEDYKNDQELLHDEVFMLRKKLRERNEIILSMQLDAKVTEEMLKNDVELLKFYTGLHEYIVFKAVFDLVKPCLPDRGKLSHFDMIMLFFVKV